MSVYNYLISESMEDEIPSIDFSVLEQLNELGLDFENESTWTDPEGSIDTLLASTNEAFIEAPKAIDNLKANLEDLKDLKNQWKKVADKFTMHKWIYRYIKDDKQEAMLKKYYNNICREDISWKDYKYSYNFLCQFFGIPNKGTIIEWITFDKDKEDKDQKKISIRYSRGEAKVNIPEGMKLIHTSPVANIKELIPVFRSKTKGKFLYPNKRVYFTVQKNIDPFKYGVGKKVKLSQYTPANKILSAYIDPTYAMFKERSVYVESEKPIPVVNYVKKFASKFRRDE